MPIVNKRHPEIPGYGLARTHQLPGRGGDLVIDLLIERVQAAAAAVQQADAHGDGAHIQLLMLDHIVGLNDLEHIQHTVFSILLYECSIGCASKSLR